MFEAENYDEKYDQLAETIAYKENACYLFGREVRNVYLAGKITGCSWRDAIIDHYCDERYGITDNGRWGLREGVIPTPSGKKLSLTGPYWQPANEWGHNCSDNSVGLHRCGKLCRNETWHTNNNSTSDISDITNKIYTAISTCDLFFAWIDDLTCYGTLVEIGLAKKWIRLLLSPCQIISTIESFGCR